MIPSQSIFKFAGFAKSTPAALPFTFVVAAPKGPPSSGFAPLVSGAFCQTNLPLTFCEP